MPAPPSIDAVFTWVDGSRADYAELVRCHAAHPADFNPERFRDPFEMLRYSLRSLEEHAPWVRNVYLFTGRPHAPAWLRRDHPRLRIVHHDEVVTEPGVLPTFNSNVIESFLHRLPGISEHFLYLNDDYFFGAPASPSDFYATDGRLKVFGTLVGERIRCRIYERQRLSFGLLEHGPLMIDRAAWGQMQNDAAMEIAELRSHRFRQPDDLRPDRLYRWHLLTHCRDRAMAEPFWRYLRYATFHKIMPGAARQRRSLTRLAQAPPRFLCLNDDLGQHSDPEVVGMVQEFLKQLFPKAGPFERGQA